MFKDKNLKAYDNNYYKRQSHMRNDYYVLANWIDKNIEGNLFGDVGCGEGYLITDLYNKFGKEVWGVDGSPAFQDFVDENIKNRIKKVDLTKKQKLDKADVAISMEVGEHLPNKSSDTFVDNIVSTDARTVIFTAAPPGQEGTNHINLQPPKFWEEKFNKRNYNLNSQLTDKFKADLGKELKHAWWYANNIIILEKA